MAIIAGAITVLAWVLGGTLILLLAVLFVPFRVAARVDGIDLTELPPEDGDELDEVDTDDATSWEVRADWLWGLLQFRTGVGSDDAMVQELRVFGIRRSLAMKRKKEKAMPSDGRRGRGRADAGKKAKRRRSRSNAGLPLELGLAFLSEAPWFVPRLWRALGVRIKGDLVYGFPDPFLTGMSQAIMAHVPNSPDLRLTPDYVQGRLTGRFQATATIFPVKIVVVLIRTGFRPAFRQTWWPQLRSAMRLSRAA